MTETKTTLMETGIGVPWDINAISVVKQDLIANDLLGEQPIPDGYLFDIMDKGKSIPYTQQARTMFAKQALIKLSNREVDDDMAILLDSAVSITLQRLESLKK